jgi:electron-transferring-flavoprotein dehydrogenase
VDIFTSFAGAEPLLGRESSSWAFAPGDKGVGKNGNPKGNYEPGIDIRAENHNPCRRCSRFADKTTHHTSSRSTKDRNPQVYAVGVKEVWDVPKQANAPGWVYHHDGMPLRNEEFGGGFIYNMEGGRVSIGLVIGPRLSDPRVDLHETLSALQDASFRPRFTCRGTLHAYGAKAIPKAVYWAQPRYAFDGGLIVGDSAGFLNSMRLKGIPPCDQERHACAEASAEALQANDLSTSRLQKFEQLVEASWIKDELWKVRNFHQGFERGFIAGVLHAGLQLITNGRGIRNRYPNVAGYTRLQRGRGFAFGAHGL